MKRLIFHRAINFTSTDNILIQFGGSYNSFVGNFEDDLADEIIAKGDEMSAAKTNSKVIYVELWEDFKTNA